MMKTSRLLLIGMFLFMAGGATQAVAEDIDLYSRPTSPKSNPNVLIILDNAANASNSASPCNYDKQPGDGLGGPSSMGATVFGNLQCAIYNAINALPDGTVNVGIMVFNATGLDKAMGLASGTCPGGNGGCLIVPITAMTAANRKTLLTYIQSWTTTNIKANNEATASTMQEAWAYFAGQVGISGRNYSSMVPQQGCQNNYIAFIGNAYDTAGSPGDPASPSASTALASAYTWALNGWNAAGGTATGMPQPSNPGNINIPSGTYGAPPGNNSCGAYTMGNHTDPSGLYADEWARFMHLTNLYYQPTGKHSITTYTIGVIGPGNCKPDYPALLTSMAIHGGGKYFANTDARGIYQSLLRILNEVQAVNSVFSASSLPVSVNTQGTYLNQIYIGMFRPDQFGDPRWYGNLKQYQFIYNPTTRNLALGDAARFPAISAAGTGFLDPSIASFWTCANSTQLSAAAVQIAPAYGQWSQTGPGLIPLCANDPVAGFWAANPNGIAAAFDMPDGDVVEKGGHAQQLRLSNLLNDYTTPAGSATNPRKLYTCAGTGCVGSQPLSSNLFQTSNTSITDAMLGVQSAGILSITSAATVAGAGANAGARAGGAAVTVTISALAKSGSTVTATVTPATDVAAKLYVGAQIAIATGATKYDCAVCVVTGVNFVAGTFTYSNPGGGGTPTLPSTATVASNTFWIWSPGNTVQLGQTLTISGCTVFTALNGTIATVVINPAYNSLPSSGFIDLSVALPLLPSATNDMGCSYTLNLATVTTSAAHGFITGATVGISGATPAGYNGVWPVTVTSPTQFTYQYTVPAPLATFGGTGAVATAGTTTRDMLMRWIRGEDNYGDELSLCPPGTAPGVNNCPNPAVNIRPSVHGDVLHSRPVVLNYGGTVVNITATSDSGTTRTATASTTDIANLRALGAVVPVTFSTGQTCTVTIATSTTFTYPNTNCGMTGAQTVSAGSNDVVVYYGGNDGVFRAIDGNPPTYTYIDPTNPANKVTITDPNAGKELWGFIAPEFFPKFKRLHDNNLQVLLASTPAGIIPAPQRKDYFADGATGFYQAIDANGKTQKAILYVTMRRGGRFIYAIDVTDKNNPIFLWKRSNNDTGFAELGQTWSLPKAVRVKGWGNPVLIFGAGYSPSQDAEPPAADTMGRGIFVVDAFTGALVWSACPSTTCTANVTGMTYAIPADLTLLDRTYNDGLVDRIYATDVGGNVWRVDLEPAKTNVAGVACSATSPTGCTPDIWQVNKLAALGCNGGVCAAGITPRKFLYPVEVVPTPNTDYVFVASGDREHPLWTDPNSTATNPLPYNFRYAMQSPPYGVSAFAVTNRAYLLKDTKPGVDGSGQTTITEAALFNCSGCSTTSPYSGTGSGYYITMQLGEKSVNAPLVVAGLIYFGTNQAQAPQPNMCEEGLGEATGYRLSPFSGVLGSGEFENGGLPPSPVAGVVNIVDPTTGKTYQVPFCLGCGGSEDNNSNNNQGANCTGESALAGCRPVINVKSSRSRPYWYRTNK